MILQFLVIVMVIEIEGYVIKFGMVDGENVVESWQLTHSFWEYPSQQ